MRGGRLLAGGLAAVLTILAGRWGMGLFTRAEYVHFSANFPVEKGYPQLPRSAIGGPWARLDDVSWKGYPPGGLLVWGRQGALTVDLGARGWIKRVFDPDSLLLSSHWIRNVGTVPRRIRLELDLCGLEAKWVTFEKEFDRETRKTTRVVGPGKTFNMDWIVTVPESVRGRSVVCSGALIVHDADSGERLTRFAIEIINSEAGEGEGGAPRT